MLFWGNQLCSGTCFELELRSAYLLTHRKLCMRSLLSRGSSCVESHRARRYQQCGPKEGEVRPICAGSKRWKSVVSQSNWVLWKNASQASLKLNFSDIPAWRFIVQMELLSFWPLPYFFPFQAATFILLGFFWNAAFASFQVITSALLWTKNSKVEPR